MSLPTPRLHICSAAVVLALLVGLLAGGPADATPPRVSAVTSAAGASSHWDCTAGVAGDTCSITADSQPNPWVINATATWKLRFPTCRPGQFTGCGSRFVLGAGGGSGINVRTCTPFSSAVSEGNYFWSGYLPSSVTCTFSVPSYMTGGPGLNALEFDGNGDVLLVHNLKFVLTTKPTPHPSVMVVETPVVPKGGLPVGSALTVPVKVTAGDTALTAVSVRLAATAGLYTITKAPANSTFTLAAGSSRTLLWTIKGRRAGQGRITVTATGTSPTGAVVSDRDIRSVPVAGTALAVTTATNPRTIRLPVSQQGKVGTKYVTVAVRLRNNSAKRLTDVVLQRAWARPVDASQQLDKVDFARGTFPLRIGVIPAGKSVLKKLKLTMTGDGEYKVDTLAMYGIPGGNARVTSTGGRFEVVVAPLWFRSKLTGSSSHGDTPVVKGGASFRLSGQIRNLSSYKTLCLWPLRPTLSGNGGGIGPVDIRVYGSGRDAVGPPVAGPVKAGTSIPIGMTVTTSTSGSTRLDLTLKPRASVLKAGGFCDATNPRSAGPPLAAANVTIVKDSSKHRGAIDVSVPSAEPASSAAKVANFFGGFTIGSVSTLGEWMISTATGAREAFVGYTHNPRLLVPTVESAYALAGFLSHYWEAATPTEKQSLATQVASVLRRAPGDTWRAAVASSASSNAKWLDSVTAAYASGDDRKIYYALGYAPGSIITDTVKDVAMAELGIGLAKQMPLLAKAFSRIGGEAVTFTSMRKLPAGKLLNAGERAALWGESAEEGALFSKIAKQEDVLIGVRSRAPISVQNMAEGAVAKYEEIKPKNVGPIDTKWLGFFAEDSGLVAMRSYSSAEKTAILARINKAVMLPWTRAGILKRAKIRFAEVSEYLSGMKELSAEGKIDVGLNYSENGLPDVISDVKLRNFNLAEQELPSKSTYYRPWQQNLQLKPGSKLPRWCRSFGGVLGVLCRITGDVDGVYVTDAAGGGLSRKKLLLVYRLLEAGGWQHPETFTWTKVATGEFWFAKKEEILQELTKGAQKVMEYAPDGKVRAVTLNLAKSKALSKSAADFVVVRDGGYVALPR